MKPLVSVSIITYNHEEFLGNCLDSILSQARDFDLEIVVGEDKSTDRTREVLSRYAAHYPGVIIPLFQAENIGANRNWQAVLDRCSGVYVAHLDGDDLMLPGKLAAQVQWLDANPGASMVFHEMVIRNGPDPVDVRLFTGPRAGKVRDVISMLEFGTVYCTSSVMFRGSSVRRERVDLRIVDIVDWLFEMQVARHGWIGYLDRPLGVYRRHAGSTTAAPWARRRRYVEEQLLAINEAGSWVGMRGAAANARRRVLYAAAVSALEAGMWREFQNLITCASGDGTAESRGQVMLFGLRWWPRLARRLWRATAWLRREAR